ncbi:unnamed protein product [Nesidiocoris tenuis]|uniref:Uncharacterized protein n=1 Tax=Nesidiocoris tenuis TaxID=355587 RepID=A0A6H5HVF6_9HEMI|nr:unnamed protein product [Nesidiocoris tenuis]
MAPFSSRWICKHFWMSRCVRNSPIQNSRPAGRAVRRQQRKSERRGDFLEYSRDQRSSLL